VPIRRDNLKQFARVGAEAKLAELRREQEAILQLFPELRRRAAGSASAPAPRRRRSKMSASARKAVSLRMRRYWAERRKKEASAKKAS
jgi:hypothetical protein